MRSNGIKVKLSDVENNKKRKRKETRQKWKGQLLFVDGCQSNPFNCLDNF